MKKELTANFYSCENLSFCQIDSQINLIEQMEETHSFAPHLVHEYPNINGLKNFRGLLAYEGTRYLGWQKTKMGASIQEELEKVLFSLLRKPISVEAASRTDAGVHARGQAINFFLDEELDAYRFLRSVNALLPKDIALLDLEPTSPRFHPTLDAQYKEYQYQISLGPVQSPFERPFSWHVPQPLDIANMRDSSKYLLGKHDFSAFCNERRLMDIDPVCFLRAIFIETLDESRLRIRIIGNRFLYRMVRNLVGTLVYVGCGKICSSKLLDILHAKKRAQAGVTAPAHGLFLERIGYDNAQ